MWVFGYDSLMYDGWERARGCIRRERAALFGYERSFTKASTLNWGSKKSPAPTLRLAPREGAVCHRIAFEFGPAIAGKVIDYLQYREGKNFLHRRVALELTSGKVVDGECFFYDGKNLIAEGELDQVVTMVLQATGMNGTGLDYIRRTKRELDDMGIRDENVDALFAAVRVGWRQGISAKEAHKPLRR